MRSRRWLVAVLLVALALAGWAGGRRLWRMLLIMHGVDPSGSAQDEAAGSDPIPLSPDGWPDSRAGAAARRWVEAFSQGETAMRDCLAEILTPESLAERGLDERIESYRSLRERFGSLVLASIDRSGPAEIEATLIASDMSRHKFVFKVQAEPPHKLVSVGRLEHRGGGHPGYHH